MIFVDTLHFLTESQVRAAWDLFRQYRDKGWSFTDATSKVVMDELSIRHAFVFDRHFRQFGSVLTVPGQ